MAKYSVFCFMSLVEFEFTRKLRIAAAIDAADGTTTDAADGATADAADGAAADAAILAALTVSRAGRSDVWVPSLLHADPHARTYTYSKLSTCGSSAIRSPSPTIPPEPDSVRKECGDSSNGHAKQHLQKGESADGKHGILPDTGSNGGHSAERVRFWHQSGRQ